MHDVVSCNGILGSKSYKEEVNIHRCSVNKITNLLESCTASYFLACQTGKMLLCGSDGAFLLTFNSTNRHFSKTCRRDSFKIGGALTK